MFCELHTRSAFSFLSSGSQPEDLAVRAAELGIAAMALIDRDTVAGAVRFHFEAREQGIKAIVGSEITMEDGSLLPLIPLNLAGYQNLAKLITTIKLRNKKGEHFATRRDIEEHSAGLMCFTGGADGFMHRSVKCGTPQADLAWLNYAFPGRLYVELQRHHLRHEEAVNQTLLGLAHKLRLPIFVSNGAYYADERARELYDVFTCIKNHTTIYKAGRLLSENSERYIKTAAQMLRLFDDMPEAVEITRDIADRVNFSMDELGYTFPDYPVPPGETMDTLLKQLVESGAVERYGGINAETRAKLDKELGLIRKLKLAGYFLVVWDISDFCKRERILSQGRGSAANSVVCYALGITAVDPIKAQLLFERFLSEERGEYPDIDIDLPSGDDRERVIQYVYQKYGRRGAAMTANVISYRGRSAIREVGKVFGFDADSLTQLSKLNPYFESFKGEELHEILREQGFDTSDERRVTKFAELYTRILDFPRHLGQHSGGMVISLGRLDGVVPIEPASMDGRTIIQWDKDDCERLGIIKVDLLGLGMMAVLRDTIELVRDHYGDDIGLYKIPPDDPKVYKALQEADTIGMFQVESRAQIAFLPKSRPENFYDIVVQVAIIRPGPVVGNMLSSYIKRRQGIEPIDYIHPRLEQTLKRTLGVPLFQEQLLKIAMDIADFTGGQAEELRRAMGFKRADRRLISIEEKLRAGMTRNDIDTATQDRIVASVKAFANYGFPESHAASFALLAYASAYFILHYRAAFMVAMFNNYPLGFYSAATLVKDAQRHGLHFLPVDINHSDYLFKIEGDKVRVGLKYIRGLRQEIGEAIVAERSRHQRLCRSICGEACLTGQQPYAHAAMPPNDPQSGGTAAEYFMTSTEKLSFSADRAAEPQNCKCGWYTDIDDLIRRVPSINKREIRALSMAGALNFDGTIHRRKALWQTELAMQPAGKLFDQCTSPHVSKGDTRDLSDPPLLTRGPTHSAGNATFLTRLEGIELVEADLRQTGITIGKHPMAFLRDELRRNGILSAVETKTLPEREIVSVAGAVIIRQRPMTAKEVVFITLEDETGHSNFVVMPDVFERFRAVINQNDYLIIRGIAERDAMIKALHFRSITGQINAAVEAHNFR
ncbi:MAG: error-prone DNA polymerase [Acidobacteriota bacterium]|nr:MAG: error-prone DNA polymerase [Acidobacteriota bacterium]